MATDPSLIPNVPVASSPKSSGAAPADSYMMDENLPLGVLAGAVAMLVCTAVWVAVTVSIEYPIGYVAVAVGLLVGLAMRWAGRGYSRVFSVIGALLALGGGVAGNLLTGCVARANMMGVGVGTALGNLDLDGVVAIMRGMFAPLNLLFYALAAMAGWKFAVVKNAA